MPPLAVPEFHQLFEPLDRERPLADFLHGLVVEHERDFRSVPRIVLVTPRHANLFPGHRRLLALNRRVLLSSFLHGSSPLVMAKLLIRDRDAYLLLLLVKRFAE